MVSITEAEVCWGRPIMKKTSNLAQPVSKPRLSFFPFLRWYKIFRWPALLLIVGLRGDLEIEMRKRFRHFPEIFLWRRSEKFQNHLIRVAPGESGTEPYEHTIPRLPQISHHKYRRIGVTGEGKDIIGHFFRAAETQASREQEWTKAIRDPRRSRNCACIPGRSSPP